MRPIKTVTLSLREKTLGFVAALALLGFAINGLAFEPLWKNYQDKQKALAKLTHKHSSLIGKLSLEEKNKGVILRAVETEFALKQKLELAKASVVGKDRLNAILSLLGDPNLSLDISLVSMSIISKSVVRRSGEIGNINYDSMIEEIDYDENRINLSLDTGFQSLAFFIRDLVNSSPGISVSRLSVLENKKRPGLNANIELLVYTRAL